MQIYNKIRSDFNSDAEWDAYIEEREDIIFCLTENVDVERTKERVKKYEAENKHLLIKNENRKRIEKQKMKNEILGEYMNSKWLAKYAPEMAMEKMVNEEAKVEKT